MAKIDSGKVARLTAATLGMALAAMLAGCAGYGTDMTARLVTTPDKYQYYDCDSIAEQIKNITTRQRALEKLMAKAGPVVSAPTYEPEYISGRGDLRELRRTAAQKQCDKKNEKPGGGRISDSIIR